MDQLSSNSACLVEAVAHCSGCPQRRRCHDGKCRSIRRGGAPCAPGECADKAALLIDDPSIVHQRAFLTHRLHGRRPARCREGCCRSLKRRGVPCAPGQCVAKFNTVHSAERLHEYLQVHGTKDKASANYWELVALIAVNEAPSPETLNVRADDAARLAQQQREYAASSQKNKRRGRKEKQKRKKHEAGAAAAVDAAVAPDLSAQTDERARLSVQSDSRAKEPP
jgi:hypothetical protein